VPVIGFIEDPDVVDYEEEESRDADPVQIETTLMTDLHWGRGFGQAR
jgi:hypothetical protein